MITTVTTPIDEAIDTVIWLLSDSCETVDKGLICSLFKLECLKTNGQLPLALLTFYVAANYLNKVATKLALQGKVTIDVVTIDYTKQATELRQIAKSYITQANEFKAEFYDTPIAVVSMVNHCIPQLEALYESCGCTKNVPLMCIPLVDCNIECCNEC